MLRNTKLPEKQRRISAFLCVILSKEAALRVLVYGFRQAAEEDFTGSRGIVCARITTTMHSGCKWSADCYLIRKEIPT